MHPAFVCPVCRASLNGDLCSVCNERYRTDSSIPVFIAQRFLDSFKETEQHFHDELSESAAQGSIKGRNSLFHRQFEAPMLALPPGACVLEVACGTRVDGIEIAKSGKLVTSIDISPEAVAHAEKFAKHHGVGDSVRFAVADAEHLPFADSSFDATFVAASFHHFPDQLAALKEMKRVTKPDGRVIWGVEPASWPYRTVYRLLAPAKRFIRSQRERKFNSIADDTTEGYTEPQIRLLFADAGLRIERITRVKMLSEAYDSSVRLVGRLLKRQLQPSRSIDHGLAVIDAVLCAIPFLNRLAWHFNVISTVPRI
jgi:ubiquinone/menaquinone biosynthesis C-methylase UbiE